MKVLFVVPNWKYHQLKYTSATIFTPKSIPLEFLYVKKMLNSEIQSKILDANVLDLSTNYTIEEIKQWNPNIVVFSTAINYLQWRCPPIDLDIPRNLAQECKKMGITTIAVGPHGTTTPEEIINEVGTDYLILGEPEISLTRFINSKLEDNKIPGVYSHKFNNGPAMEISMCDLPIPDYDAIDQKLYECHTWSNNVNSYLKKNNFKGAIIEFSRGCMFNCPFCLRFEFRKNYRKKSIDQMRKEVKILKDMGIKYLFFIDEIFNIESDDLSCLLDTLAEEELLFGCQARPDYMTYELITKFKKSGCIYIEYGIESFSEEVLKKINKNIDINMVKKVLLYTYQIIGKENTMLGLINFYTNDIKKILGLKDENTKWVSKVVRPYPGSLIGEKLLELYNIKEAKWDFILRYTWWEQIENFSNYFKDGIAQDPNIKQKILFDSMEKSKEISYRYMRSYKEKFISSEKK